VTTARKFRELRPHIATILLRDWDPIGIRDDSEAQGEYDSYLPGVVGLLSRTPSAKDVASYLIGIETREMGLSPVPIADRLPVAHKLIGLATELGLCPGPYPCPACGFLSFSEPPGSYDVCPLCGWEDDAVQLRHPALKGGANHESLIDAQRQALARYPSSLQVAKGVRRDPVWRPLTDAESTAAIQSLGPGGRLPAIGQASNDSLYYWLAHTAAG
jgi:hypothetical protein